MKFPAVVRWNPYTQEWRILSYPMKTHWLEIFTPHWIFRLLLPRFLNCEFVQKIVETETLSREQDNLVSVEIKFIKYISP